jgi:hypothetical protein
MIVALIILFGGIALSAVILGARSVEASTWRRRLLAYRVTFPADGDEEVISAWFSSVAAITHRPRWSVLPLPPVAWEVVAEADGIAYHLLISRENADSVLSSLRATVPGTRVVEQPDYFRQRPRVVVAAEATLTSRVRPLALTRRVTSNSSFLASMQPVPKNAAIVLQWIITSRGTPAPIKQPPAKDSGRRLPWLLDDEAPVDTEAVRQARIKQQEPLLHGTLRIGVATPNAATGYKLLGRVWGHLQGMNAPGVRVVRRYLPSAVVHRRLNDLVVPVTRWPMLLNSHELAGLAGLPVSDVPLPGLDRSAARQLPAPPGLPTRGTVIATSNYAGMIDRPLALAIPDLLKHAYVVAPTGAGKSWLLASMILQIVDARHGVLAIDVKGDLVADVLARVSDADAGRIVVIDPSKRDRPVGLNVLASGQLDRELVVDNVLHTFREIWSSSWGPRTDYVIRNTLLTLALSRSADGQAFTICEIVPLLTNHRFRVELLGRSELPANLRTFWQRYEAMSLAEQTQVIGPTLNKIDAFTSRSAIRLMLGQSTGVDLASIFFQRKVILISLAKGQLGAETANLLGALLVSALWHATLGRVSVASSRRPATFAFLDEAQDIVRLPVAMADMLAQARGLGLGVTLANQYVAQLPETVKNAVLGTVRTQIAFQLDYDDARLLERRFAPLSQQDLMGLQEYEIAMRPCVAGRTLTPVTGRTLPLDEPVRDPEQLAARARHAYGVPAAEVELAIAHRQETRPRSTAFGREDLGGAS